MKHFRPIYSVWDSTHFCGTLLFNAKGWDAHDAAGKRIGCFEDDAKAVARLRAMAASRPST
jgi:hypothetical protein